MITFGKRWKPYPWLFWLSPIYWFFSRLHRAYMLATFEGFPKPPTIPLVVIGALKAGGSGKTSVTLALARIFSERGFKVAILAYQLGGRRRFGNGSWRGMLTGGLSRQWNRPKKRPALAEVGDGADWRLFSDESVMLKRMSNCRVFVTRNRAKAWMALHSTEVAGAVPFDLILSDDGFQDPRLEGAFRILLMAPGERPELVDLIPAGPFRETKAAQARANILLFGPISKNTVPLPQNSVPPRLPKIVRAQNFYRTLSLPDGMHLQRPWIAYCALGDNESFIKELKENGIYPVAVVQDNDHAEPRIRVIQTWLRRFPGAGILVTQKDYLKFGSELASNLPIFLVGQETLLEPETVAFIEAFRVGFALSNLVHYPE